MTPAIRFTVITDDAARTARAMFGGEVPSFVRIITDPKDIHSLPEGTLAFGRFWTRVSPAAAAFDAVDRRRTLRFPDNTFFNRLNDWLDRRDAHRLAPIHSAADDSVTGFPAVSEGDGTKLPAPQAEAREIAPRRLGAGWK